MSRGRGRGGAGLGGRGRGPAGTQRIAGVDITADAELLLGIGDRPQPTPLFPENRITLPKPLTKDERIQVARFRSLRDRIHEGPLYTVLGDNARVGKAAGEKGRSAAAQFDPFEGMPTYSQRYTRKKRKIPKLDTRPYVLKFFPKELWSTLDSTQSTTNGAEPIPKSKKLQISTSKPSNGLVIYDREFSGEPSRDPLSRLANGGDDDDDTADQNMEDELAPEEEDVDNDYASEEDEMGGDYNAEQYFDDGGDDAGEDYDAGEADGDVY